MQLHDHLDGSVHGAGYRDYVHLVLADSTQVSQDSNGDEATVSSEGEAANNLLFRFLFPPFLLRGHVPSFIMKIYLYLHRFLCQHLQLGGK